MVKGGASGTSSAGRGYAEAYCLVAGGGVMMPNATQFGRPLIMESMVLTEEDATQDFETFVDSLEKDGCYTIDASARTAGDRFFGRSTQLCADGFDEALVCIFGIGTAVFECPNPSILATVTGARYNSNNEVDTGFREDWDNVGRPNGSPRAQMNVMGCSSGGLTRSQTRCGSTVYSLLHEPTLSLGYGLFEVEPCGTYQSVDCKVGDSTTMPSSLGHCTWVDRVPTKAPTPSAAAKNTPDETGASNTETTAVDLSPSPQSDTGAGGDVPTESSGTEAEDTPSSPGMVSVYNKFSILVIACAVFNVGF